MTAAEMDSQTNRPMDFPDRALSALVAREGPGVSTTSGVVTFTDTDTSTGAEVAEGAVEWFNLDLAAQGTHREEDKELREQYTVPKAFMV